MGEGYRPDLREAMRVDNLSTSNTEKREVNGMELMRDLSNLLAEKLGRPLSDAELGKLGLCVREIVRAAE